MQPLPYRREGDRFLIEMHLSRIGQLFDTLDPSPFRERDLDPAAEHYLIGAIEELPAHAPCKILIHLPPAELDTAAAASAPDAIRHHFSWLASEAARRLRAHLREARAALVLGGLFLASCLGLSSLIRGQLSGLLADLPRGGRADPRLGGAVAAAGHVSVRLAAAAAAIGQPGADRRRRGGTEPDPRLTRGSPDPSAFAKKCSSCAFLASQVRYLPGLAPADQALACSIRVRPSLAGPSA